VRILGHVMTNPGKVRSNNEDSVALLRQSAPDGADDFVVALVADGMGGHECGEVASQLAAQLIPAALFQRNGEVPLALEKAFAQTNGGIQKAAQTDARRHGMGTTCAVVVVEGDQAWGAWVGDSRIYLLRDDGCYRLSQDHTIVAEMVRSGHITEDDARHHADRNVLSRALGTRPKVEVDVLRQPTRLQQGDRILLCSDGLHDLVVDEEIGELARSGELSDCVQALVQLALDRGGYDNVSVVLMEVSPEGLEVKTTREVVIPC
jgi:serine/threonine protein phosphatase PrpC